MQLVRQRAVVESSVPNRPAAGTDDANARHARARRRAERRRCAVDRPRKSQRVVTVVGDEQVDGRRRRKRRGVGGDDVETVPDVGQGPGDDQHVDAVTVRRQLERVLERTVQRRRLFTTQT